MAQYTSYVDVAISYFLRPINYMARYGKTAPARTTVQSGGQKKVEKTMHEFKRGQLKSGRSGKTVRSRKQAIAIGLSQARKEGEKVPNPPKRRGK